MSDFDFWKALRDAHEELGEVREQGARWSANVLFAEISKALEIADDPSRHNGTHTAIARLREIVTRYERGELEDVGRAIADAGRSAAAAQDGTTHVGELPSFLTRSPIQPLRDVVSTTEIRFSTSPDGREYILSGVTVDGKANRVVRLTEAETGVEITSRRIYPGVTYVAEIEEARST